MMLAYPNFGVNGPLPLAPNQLHQISHFANLNMARSLIREIRTRRGGSAAVTSIHIGGEDSVGNINTSRHKTGAWLVQAAQAMQRRRISQTAGLPLNETDLLDLVQNFVEIRE